MCGAWIQIRERPRDSGKDSSGSVVVTETQRVIFKPRPALREKPSWQTEQQVQRSWGRN